MPQQQASSPSLADEFEQFRQKPAASGNLAEEFENFRSAPRATSAPPASVKPAPNEQADADLPPTGTVPPPAMPTRPTFDPTRAAAAELAKSGLPPAAPPENFSIPKSQFGPTSEYVNKRNAGKTQAQIQSERDQFARETGPSIPEYIAKHPVEGTAKLALGTMSPGGEGLVDVATAPADYVRTFTHPEQFGTEEEASKARTAAGTKLLSGAMSAVTPAFSVAGIANPGKVATGLATGMATGAAAEKVSKELGASQETQDLAETAGFFLPSFAGLVAEPRVTSGLTERGAAANLDIFGGRAAGGVEVTPQGEVSVGAKIGNKEFGPKVIRRGTPVPAPQPTIEPPTIEGEPVTPAQPSQNTAIATQNRMVEDAQSMARVVARENPAPPPPPVPQVTPPPPPQLNDETAKQVGEAIKSLPPEQQSPAILEATHKSAESIAHHGGAVIDGEVVTVPKGDQKAALKVATKVIQSQIEKADAENAQNRPESAPAISGPRSEVRAQGTPQGESSQAGGAEKPTGQTSDLHSRIAAQVDQGNPPHPADVAELRKIIEDGGGKYVGIFDARPNKPNGIHVEFNAGDGSSDKTLDLKGGITAEDVRKALGTEPREKSGSTEEKVQSPSVAPKSGAGDKGAQPKQETPAEPYPKGTRVTIRDESDPLLNGKSGTVSTYVQGHTADEMGRTHRLAMVALDNGRSATLHPDFLAPESDSSTPPSTAGTPTQSASELTQLAKTGKPAETKTFQKGDKLKFSDGRSGTYIKGPSSGNILLPHTVEIAGKNEKFSKKQFAALKPEKVEAVSPNVETPQKSEPGPGSPEYEALKRKYEELTGEKKAPKVETSLAESPAPSSPKEEGAASPESTEGKTDEELFRQGVARAERRSGSEADNFNRVLDGVARVLEAKGYQPEPTFVERAAEMRKEYGDKAGTAAYYELGSIFHYPLAGMGPHRYSDIVDALQGTLPKEASFKAYHLERVKKLDFPYEWTGGSSSMTRRPIHSPEWMRKDLEGGAVGKEIKSTTGEAEAIRVKANIVAALTTNDNPAVVAARKAADEYQAAADKFRARAEELIADEEESLAKDKAAEERMPITRAEQVRPISELHLRPKEAWQPSVRAWIGDTQWLTDGHIAINMEGATMAQRKSIARFEPEPSQQKMAPAALDGLFKHVVPKAKQEGDFVGYTHENDVSRGDAQDKAFFASKDGKTTVVLNAHKYRVITNAIGTPSKIMVGKHDDGVVFYKGDKVAAIAMPLRDAPSIDRETALKTLATASSTPANGKGVKTQESVSPQPEVAKENPSATLRSSVFGLDIAAEAAAKAIGKAAVPVKEWLGDKAEKVRQAKELNEGLADLHSQYQADVLRAVQMMKDVPGTAKDEQAIYHWLENPAEKLSPEQQAIHEEWIKPFEEEAQRIYVKLTEGGTPIPGYVHRVVRDKGSLIDRILSGSKGSGQGNVLSKYAPATKGRTMMAVTDADGNRNVVSVKGGRVVKWEGGVPVDLGGLRSGLTTKEGLLHERIAPINRAIRKLQHERVVLNTVKGRVPGKNSVHGVEPTFAQRKRITTEIDKLEKQRDAIVNSVGEDELKDQVFIDKAGRELKFSQATTKEIEKETGVRYYHNALASGITNYLNLRKAERAYDFIENLKASPEFGSIAVKQDVGNPPKGWRMTTLPQLRGYYLEPHTADVLDRFASKLGSKGPSVFDQVGQFLRTSIFFNPLIHVPNITVHAIVEKGVTGWGPQNWANIARSGVKAIRAVTKQNDDYLEALDGGAPMQYQRFENKQFADLFFKKMADELEGNPSVGEKVAKALGYANPVNLVKAIYNTSGKVTWWTNDVAFLQATYEKTAKGMPLKEALRETAKHIPDYRLPAHVMGSRTLAQLMENPNLSMFSQYHYGALRSYGEMLKDAVGSNVDPKERAHAWDVMAMLALMTMVIYPFADKALQSITGDKNARLRRAGASTFPFNLYQMFKGEKTPTEAMEATITPAVHTKAAVELAFNRDLFTGRHIYNPHDTAGEIAGEVGHKLGESIAPISQASRIQEDRTALRKFGYGLVGVSFPLHGAEKRAQEIAINKMGTEAATPEERKQAALRHEVLDAATRGDFSKLGEAIREGVLDREQARQIRAHARLDPLVAKTWNFTYPELKEVYDLGTPEQQAKLRPQLLRKRMRLLLRGKRAEVEAGDAR